MAAIFILVGGVCGLATAIASVLLAGSGLLAALAIWSVIGIAFSALGIATAMLPRHIAKVRRNRIRQSV